MCISIPRNTLAAQWFEYKNSFREENVQLLSGAALFIQNRNEKLKVNKVNCCETEKKDIHFSIATTGSMKERKNKYF